MLINTGRPTLYIYIYTKDLVLPTEVLPTEHAEYVNMVQENADIHE
jgi:hypothetical protein